MAGSRTDALRRRLLRLAAVALAPVAAPRGARATDRADAGAADRAADPITEPVAAQRRWHAAAVAMQRLAQSWGDEPYGAVLVAGGAVIGEGPSRVVQRGDPTAHAEREAIRDAQRRLGRIDLSGSVLYSTSRPCRQCESAAAQAHVARMIHGPELNDAGRPAL